jgi:hypothetical protein
LKDEKRFLHDFNGFWSFYRLPIFLGWRDRNMHNIILKGQLAARLLKGQVVAANLLGLKLVWRWLVTEESCGPLRETSTNAETVFLEYCWAFLNIVVRVCALTHKILLNQAGCA